jgi:hypothetical protein
MARSYTYLRILDQKIKLLLAIADIILIKAIVEIIACILCANIEWSIHISLTILLACLSRFLFLFLLLTSLWLLMIATCCLVIFLGRQSSIYNYFGLLFVLIRRLISYFKASRLLLLLLLLFRSINLILRLRGLRLLFFLFKWGDVVWWGLRFIGALGGRLARLCRSTLGIIHQGVAL